MGALNVISSIHPAVAAVVIGVGLALSYATGGWKGVAMFSAAALGAYAGSRAGQGFGKGGGGHDAGAGAAGGEVGGTAALAGGAGRAGAVGYESSPITGIINGVLADGHLTLAEANSIYRVNTDPNLLIVVDASKLTVTMTGFPNNGKIPAVVLGQDYLVHGQVTLRQETMGILNGQYDFEMHTPHWDPINILRNAETVIGSMVAGSGTSFWIKYEGKPNVFVPVVP